ncbi:MAG: hypothetical protein JO166_19060 [Deltaproteobacteria bacterium]|nr:hypothetical protein [Deltaproteobacteria bacterium]
MRRLFVVALLLAVLTASYAHAQYNPIPNFTGTLAGQQFRNALNNKLSGADTVSPRLVPITFSQLPATVTNGQLFYVTDGAPGTPCAGGGPGAIAMGLNGVWSCGPVPGGIQAPTSVSCSHKTTVVGAGTFGAGATNYAGNFTTPNSTTDVDNCTITFSTPAASNRICAWRVSNADGTLSEAGVQDTSTTTTAKVDFASGGGTVTGGGKLTVGYTCF